MNMYIIYVSLIIYKNTPLEYTIQGEYEYMNNIIKDIIILGVLKPLKKHLAIFSINVMVLFWRVKLKFLLNGF